MVSFLLSIPYLMVTFGFLWIKKNVLTQLDQLAQFDKFFSHSSGKLTADDCYFLDQQFIV